MRFAVNIFLIISIFLTSCSKSVLSDMEISNPDVLKVKVKIEQNEHNGKEVQVYIRDKKDRPIDLYSGKVVVNGYRTRFERAHVNAAGTRGYMYVPHNSEQSFEISVFWNEYDYHTFILSPETGFPGFYHNSAYSCGCHDDDHYSHRSYELRPAPFYRNRIKVEYKILN